MNESDFDPNQTNTTRTMPSQDMPSQDMPSQDADAGARAENAPKPINQAAPKVLIAEDEYLIAASIRDALMRYDKPLDAVVVQRTNMLVDNLNNLNPDVLLMDITLKGAMDGIEAIQHIKNSGRNFPVIYITADSRITTLERAEGTEPVAYLIKPFREADLHKALTKALALLEE